MTAWGTVAAGSRSWRPWPVRSTVRRSVMMARRRGPSGVIRVGDEVFLKSVVFGAAVALLGALVGGFVARR
jgi:hypothetical protein